MMNFTKNVLTLLIAIVSMGMTNHVSAQFFTEDFGDEAEFQTEWVTGGTNGGAQEWMWTIDAGSATFGTQPDFVSTTVANGFILFNSDANGDVVHDVTVTMTSPIDATTADQVFIEFQNQYAYYSGSSNAQVGVSTNGVDFTYYTVLTDVEQNVFTAANQTVIVELPEAANQAEVWLQFRWAGNYEYGWKIDDVSLYDSNPLPAVQYNIGAYTFYPPSSYSQPIEQIEVDSFGFFAEVINTGLGDLTDIVVTASVRSEAGTEFYTASATVDVLESGSSDTVDIEGLFSPSDLVVGNYNIVYEITAGEGEDENVADNVHTSPFVISADRFSKIESVLVANRPGGDTDYILANVYQTSPNILPGVLAFGDATFSAEVRAEDGDNLEGRNANIFLAAVVNSEVDQNWSTFNTTEELFTNPGLELLAYIPHTFVGANFDEQTVQLKDIDNEELIYMEPDTRYLLGIQLEGDDKVVNIGYSDAINYYQISTVAYTTQWFLGGLGADFSPNLNVAYALPTNTTDTALPEGAMLVFPNPANQQITLEVDLESAGRANIVVADLTGKIMKMNEYQTLSNGTYNFDVSNYPNGVYMARLITDQGSHTVKFTVQH